MKMLFKWRITDFRKHKGVDFEVFVHFEVWALIIYFDRPSFGLVYLPLTSPGEIGKAQRPKKMFRNF